MALNTTFITRQLATASLVATLTACGAETAGTAAAVAGAQAAAASQAQSQSVKIVDGLKQAQEAAAGRAASAAD